MLHSFILMCFVLRRSPTRRHGQSEMFALKPNLAANGQVGRWGQTHGEAVPCSWMLVSSYCSNKRKGKERLGSKERVRGEEESRQVWGETEANLSRKRQKKKRKEGNWWWTEKRKNVGRERTQDEYRREKKAENGNMKIKVEGGMLREK